MPARNGSQYLERLRVHPKNLWIEGEKVEDVTGHRAFSGCADSIASLYEMQHDVDLSSKMTFNPGSGDKPEGLSFITPTSREHLVQRGSMMLRWARFSGGVMARTPDYMNVILMACSAASDFFGKDDKAFGQNIKNYFRYVMENDLTLTHTLVNVRKTKKYPSYAKGDDLGLHLTRERDDGIIVKGARILATLAPLSDEILVFPSSVVPTDKDASKFALAFGISCDTPGLKFLCREALSVGKSAFDHPLSSKFDEGDALVIFDDVFVPWDKVFICNNVEIANSAFSNTRAGPHINHQIVTKNMAKAEFVLGLAALMTEALSTNETPYIQALASELITVYEVSKACLEASISNAKMNEWGVMEPDSAPLSAAKSSFTSAYPRLIEILQLIGSSSLIAVPSDADFDSDIGGLLEEYLSTDTLDAKQRTKLFRMGWDISVSSFGGRQVLYERFFSGDPHRTAALSFSSYDKELVKKRALEIIDRG